jgi:hypothetical protein
MYPFRAKKNLQKLCRTVVADHALPEFGIEELCIMSINDSANVLVLNIASWAGLLGGSEDAVRLWSLFAPAGQLWCLDGRCGIVIPDGIANPDIEGEGPHLLDNSWDRWGNGRRGRRASGSVDALRLVFSLPLGPHVFVFNDGRHLLMRAGATRN